jgi:hypothetical protein
MFKTLVCALFGHDWKVIESSDFSSDPSREVFVAIEVCERCGRFNIAEEIRKRWCDGVADLESTVLAINKDFYSRRRDLKPRCVVG